MADFQKLPIFHIYIPSTLSKVVDNFFRNNVDIRECYLLGQYERKSDKPGKRKAEGEGVMTRSKSASRLRSKTDADNTSSPSSRSYPGKVRSAGTTLDKNENDSGALAVNVLGVTRDFSDVSQFCGENIQVIGRILPTSVDLSTRHMDHLDGAFPLLFQFQYFEGCLRIPSVIWNGFQHNFSTNTPNRHTQIILFEYDPEEFQRWMIPKTHPLGLPPVFRNGLAVMQNYGRHKNEASAAASKFIPAFVPIPQDHQDLNACFKVPENSFMYTNPVLRFCCQRSAGIQQIAHKVFITTEAILGAYPILPVVNFFFLLVLDSIIGCIITNYLIQIPDMLGLLHVTVEQMLVKLNHLLKWLRGAPAGLKLNINLNSLYWRFFSYHIHLWASYIGILEPIFAIIIHTIQYFGILGATVQITLLKDLLSLATFHVYCLYIYASRLYALQISAIKALCRVFFGRKYNPLRNRIDSVQLTTPELFLSSFGFVILIFLFPTTVVYYTGFLCLRVPSLFVERTLQYFVTTYNQLPFISWLLVFLKSPRVADEVYLIPENYCRDSSIVKFRLCLQSTRTFFTPPDFGSGFRKIISSCLGGTVLKE